MLLRISKLSERPGSFSSVGNTFLKQFRKVNKGSACGNLNNHWLKEINPFLFVLKGRSQRILLFVEVCSAGGLVSVEEG